MKKHGIEIGIGWMVWCVLSIFAEDILAQEAPKTNAADSETAGQVEQSGQKAPKINGASSVEVEGVATPVEGEKPKDVTSADGSTKTLSPSGEASTSATTQTAQASESAQATETKVEIVPEAISSRPSAPTATYVEIEPSASSKKKLSEGNRKILVGTWTKSILFSTEDNTFRFQPKGGLQAKFAIALNPDEATNNKEPMDGTGFSFHRARLGFQAWFLNFGKFNLDTEWKTGKGEMLEYFVDLGPNNGDGGIAVRVGLFKPYLSRQFLQSSFQTAMIDSAKAWTNLDFVSTPNDTKANQFTYRPFPLIQRELGIALQGFAANGIEYGVGLWNGSDGYDTDADFMYGGRIAMHPMGLAGGNALRIGDESDTEISSSPSMSIGVAAFLEDRNDATVDLPGECPSQDLLSMCPYEDYKLRSGLDIAFKYAGLSLEGEFFILKSWAKQAVINQWALERFHRDAPGVSGYLQVSYMIVPKRFEIAGRFDALDENVEIRGVQFYPSIGAAYFVFGNNLKAQFQYRINIGTGYVEGEDAMYMPLSHDFLFMLQASI